MDRLGSKKLYKRKMSKICCLLVGMYIITMLSSISFAASNPVSNPVKTVALTAENLNGEIVTHSKPNETFMLDAKIIDPKHPDEPEYRFFYKDDNEKSSDEDSKDKDLWHLVFDWSSDSEAVCKLSNEGKYTLKVEVKSGTAEKAEAPEKAKASENAEASATYLDFIVTDKESADNVKSVKISATPNTLVLKGEEIKLTASASGDSMVEYRFSKKYLNTKMNEGEWTVIRGWSTNKEIYWSDPIYKGEILFKVEARTVNSSTEIPCSDVVDYMIAGALLSNQIQTVDLTLSGTTYSNNSIINGNQLQIKAKVSYKPEQRGTPLYRYWIKKKESKWEVVQDWSVNDTMVWTPADIGNYEMCIETKTKDIVQSSLEVEAFKYITNFQVIGSDVKAQALKVTASASPSSPRLINKKINITATAAAGDKQVSDCLYRFYVKDEEGINILLSDWSNASSVEWVPKNKGEYTLTVDAKKAGDTAAEGTASVKYLIVDQMPEVMNTVQLLIVGGSKYSLPGDEIQLTAQANAASQDNKYLLRYFLTTVKKDSIIQSPWTSINNGQAMSNWTWTVPNPYSDSNVIKAFISFEVQVKDSNANEWKVCDIIENYGILNNKDTNSINFVDITINKEKKEITASAVKGDTLELKAASQENASAEYKFVCSNDDGSIITVQDWSENKTASYTPNTAGIYEFTVYARAKGSSNIGAVKKKVITVLGIQQENVIEGFKLIADPAASSNYGTKVKLIAPYKKDAKYRGEIYYQFWVKEGSEWTALSDAPTESNEAVYTPAHPGEVDFKAVVLVGDQATEPQAASYIKGYVISKGDVQFKDVTKDHWAYKEITGMAQKAVVQGIENGVFQPNSNVTREQFAKMIVNSLRLSLPEKHTVPDYADVNSDSNANWAWNYIIKADEYLEASGKKFRPQEAATRFEIAEALVKFYEEKYGPIDTSTFEENKYTELTEGKLKEEEKSVIKKAVSAGIMNGYENNKGTYSFNPDGKVTRAETSVVLYRISLKNKY